MLTARNSLTSVEEQIFIAKAVCTEWRGLGFTPHSVLTTITTHRQKRRRRELLLFGELVEAPHEKEALSTTRMIIEWHDASSVDYTLTSTLHRFGNWGAMWVLLPVSALGRLVSDGSLFWGVISGEVPISDGLFFILLYVLSFLWREGVSFCQGNYGSLGNSRPLSTMAGFQSGLRGYCLVSSHLRHHIQ